MFSIKRHCEYCADFILVSSAGLTLTLASYDRDECAVAAGKIRIKGADRAEQVCDLLNRTFFPDAYEGINTN